MIAALDALIPPLDPALGFLLLLAACTGGGLAHLFDWARREKSPPEPDPHATAYGDVAEAPRLRQ